MLHFGNYVTQIHFSHFLMWINGENSNGTLTFHVSLFPDLNKSLINKVTNPLAALEAGTSLNNAVQAKLTYRCLVVK